MAIAAVGLVGFWLEHFSADQPCCSFTGMKPVLPAAAYLANTFSTDCYMCMQLSMHRI